MGVGSTVVAALKSGRSGYGCDNVSEYVKVAHKRVKDLRAGVLQTRPMNKPVYDPSLPGGGH
jgi:adenine-specific DNA-methyltransferase